MPIRYVNDYLERQKRRRANAAPGDDIVSPIAEVLLKSVLLEDERILQIGMISAGIYWKSALVLVLTVIFLIYAFPLGIFMLFVTLSMFVLAYMTQDYLVLGATDKRVIIRFGILNRELVQLPYDRIESIEVLTTPMGMLLGYGNVMLSGVGMKRIMIPFIANASEFRDIISQILIEKANQPAIVVTVPSTAGQDLSDT